MTHVSSLSSPCRKCKASDALDEHRDAKRILLRTSPKPPRRNRCPLTPRPGARLPAGARFKTERWRADAVAANRATMIESIGLGTRESPRIEWRCLVAADSDSSEEDGGVFSQYAYDWVLHDLAVQYGCTHCYVYRTPSDLMAVWDENPDAGDGLCRQWLVRADTHLAVRLGTRPEHYSIYGNVFITRASKDDPYRLMLEEQRRYVFQNDKRPVQLYFWETGSQWLC